MVCCSVVLAGLPSLARASDESLHVVFVGNSYTYTNDLPMLFRALVHSQTPERDVETEAFVVPGGFLNERWREGVVQHYLKSNQVDVLVLQEAGGWNSLAMPRRYNDAVLAPDWSERLLEGFRAVSAGSG